MQTIQTYEKYNIVSFCSVPIIATVKGIDEGLVRVIAWLILRLRCVRHG